MLSLVANARPRSSALAVTGRRPCPRRCASTLTQMRRCTENHIYSVLLAYWNDTHRVCGLAEIFILAKPNNSYCKQGNFVEFSLSALEFSQNTSFTFHKVMLTHYSGVLWKTTVNCILVVSYSCDRRLKHVSHRNVQMWRFSEVYHRSVRYRPASSLAVRTQNAINLACAQPIHIRHYSIAVYTRIAYDTVKL